MLPHLFRGEGNVITCAAGRGHSGRGGSSRPAASTVAHRAQQTHRHASNDRREIVNAIDRREEVRQRFRLKGAPTRCSSTRDILLTPRTSRSCGKKKSFSEARGRKGALTASPRQVDPPAERRQRAAIQQGIPAEKAKRSSSSSRHEAKLQHRSGRRGGRQGRDLIRSGRDDNLGKASHHRDFTNYSAN